MTRSRVIYDAQKYSNHDTYPILRIPEKGTIVRSSRIGGASSRGPKEKIFEQAIRLNLPLVCSNPDILGVSGKKIHPSTGDLAIQYKKLGGKTHIIGKPGIEIFNFAYNKTSVPKEKVLMIGDSLFNDIYGANQFKIDSLLVTSGIHREFFLSNKDPLEIIDNIHSDYQNTGIPTYIMGKLK